MAPRPPARYALKDGPSLYDRPRAEKSGRGDPGKPTGLYSGRPVEPARMPPLTSFFGLRSWGLICLLGFFCLSVMINFLYE